MSKAPPTPTNIRRPKALPLDSENDDLLAAVKEVPDTSLPPLVLPSAGTLLDFPTQDEALSGLTPAQLYDMNQDLYRESVPARALIDAVAPMSELRSEYENGSAVFLKEIDWLIANGYTYVRRTRGDGDCFYRSLGFAYIHRLLSLEPQARDIAVATALSLIDGHPAILDDAGIERLVYEDYYELLKEIVEKAGKGMTEAELLETFQTPENSNAVVLYLRLLTSAQIRLKRDNYEGFLVHPDTKELMSVDSFTANVVQAMGKEADNVEIDALSHALQLNLDLAYLNGVREDGVDFIPFRNAINKYDAPLVLLYRPGHYDILVKQ